MCSYPVDHGVIWAIVEKYSQSQSYPFDCEVIQSIVELASRLCSYLVVCVVIQLIVDQLDSANDSLHHLPKCIQSYKDILISIDSTINIELSNK